MAGPAEEKGGRTPSLTDVEGLRVGHYNCPERPTGCTVVTSRTPFTAGADIRGGAPGTFDCDLLRSENLVGAVDAVFLAGGSAFGLAVASGVARWLEERGRGYRVGEVRVPIVCGAILFDLALGDARIRPDASAGYQACEAADTSPVREGNVGAGAGATIGTYFGMEQAMKGGLGSWCLQRPDGLQVGALVAVNCVGDVVDPSSGAIVGGARNIDRSGFVDVTARLREGSTTGARVLGNTVIGLVATNAALTKTQCNVVARMAHAGIARCVYPAHTPWDGDALFALSTGAFVKNLAGTDAGVIGALAADVLATAIIRGVRAAHAWGPYPGLADRMR